MGGSFLLPPASTTVLFPRSSSPALAVHMHNQQYTTMFRAIQSLTFCHDYNCMSLINYSLFEELQNTILPFQLDRYLRDQTQIHVSRCQSSVHSNES
jgi:hypothetical protein